jgi:hypothetical protein
VREIADFGMRNADLGSDTSIALKTHNSAIRIPQSEIDRLIGGRLEFRFPERE